jgi:hypothetical protein
VKNCNLKKNPGLRCPAITRQKSKKSGLHQHRLHPLEQIRQIGAVGNVAFFFSRE